MNLEKCVIKARVQSKVRALQLIEFGMIPLGKKQVMAKLLYYSVVQYNTNNLQQNNLTLSLLLQMH